MQIKDRWVFFLSTVIHTGFMGWLTHGENYVPIFLFSIISCFLILPITYAISWKFSDTLNKYKIIHQSRWEKTISTLLVGEGIFMIIFIISSIGMIFIKDIH